MKAQVNEQISALADGELTPDESRFALRRLEHDADLRQSWSRLHLARDVLRRQAALPAPAGFAHGVMARLDADDPAQRATAPWLKTAAGGLIAAGVAADPGAIDEADWFDEGPTDEAATSDAELAVEDTLFAVAPRETVAPQAPVPTLAATTPITTEDLRPRIGSLPASDSIVTPLRTVHADPRLDQYLIQHSDATRGGARGGYVPYVYIVSSPAGGPRPPLRPAADGR